MSVKRTFDLGRLPWTDMCLCNVILCGDILLRILLFCILFNFQNLVFVKEEKLR